MKVNILKENLLRALTQTGRAISSKTQLPILQNIHVKTEENMLRFTATNMETIISCLVGVKIEKEGGVCVPAKVFTELITSLSSDTVTLEAREGEVIVKTDNTEATIAATPEAEYPPFSFEIKGDKIKVDINLLKDALKKTLYAAATDDGRPLLTGIKIVSQNDETTFAATDGYRLSVVHIKETFGKDFNHVVPARALAEVNKTISEFKEEKPVVLGNTSDGQLAFLLGDTTILTRLIDGEYPDFDKIVPKNHTTDVKGDKTLLLSAVKSASIFARDNANIVRFHAEKNTLMVSANTPQVGNNMVRVNVATKGDGGDIAFNSRFLIDFLNNYDGDEVVFEMTGSLNPGVFKGSADGNFLHIIMPVRVQN